jgi:hypothetical protein
VQFFFPDSHDLVDPSFDFEAETRAAGRLRQRDDLYAHELFAIPPYDGVLVSKAIVDGSASGAGKYTIAQRHRLLRLGVRDFLRLDERAQTRHLLTMGDCGAFSYVTEDEPPYTVEQVFDFYEACGFDLGLSVDHVIIGFISEDALLLPATELIPAAWRSRQQLTLSLAADFLRLHRARKPRFNPVGVAQGWSTESYAFAVSELQRIGYKRIALGGMVPLKTPEILATLAQVSAVRRKDTKLHLLGVTRTDQVGAFASYGVTSFDSTSPLLRAFKDARENYFTRQRSYTALRIPQVEGNPSLQRLISSGAVDQGHARTLEQRALRLVRDYDRGLAKVDTAVRALSEFDALFRGGTAKHVEASAQTLRDAPWKSCTCEVCQQLGVEVVIFRGAERNRRRGFHNIWMLRQKLHSRLSRTEAASSSESVALASGAAAAGN